MPPPAGNDRAGEPGRGSSLGPRVLHGQTPPGFPVSLFCLRSWRPPEVAQSRSPGCLATFVSAPFLYTVSKTNSDD